MSKKTKIKLAGVILGAALSSTSVYAYSGACGAGKCAPGKCGANIQKPSDEMSGDAGKKTQMTCGAGKCGASMMKPVPQVQEADEMNGKAGKKTEMACAAGKCGTNMNNN